MSRPSRLIGIVFLVACAVALAFAYCTNHVWEDFYITYRSSLNLATGHGLVFNHGDRLHTFTSPLGVLLPALASLLTLNASDTAALWIFRVMCSAAFGGAAAFLVAGAQARRWALAATLLLAAWFVTDAKSVDFTINGMETGLLLFFLAYSWWALSTGGRQRILHLGVAWAGVMWTRPDGCIYIALLGATAWVFHDAKATGESRMQLLAGLAKAGALCALLYLPWFLSAWWYYGTPVPHTITAKNAVSGARSLSGLLQAAVLLPLRLWQTDGTALQAMFLPSYFVIGGWPTWIVAVGRLVALIAGLLWLCPGVDRATRAVSLVFYGGSVYLSYFPYFPFPWYLPGVALFGFLALAGGVSRLLEWSRSPAETRAAAPAWTVPLRRGVLGLAALSVAGSALLLYFTGEQMAAQQRLVENGVRRKLGEWLKAHAQPGDTVFTEALGYIGFFSGLKTFDFPGMSSREMVAQIRQNHSDWELIVRGLRPKWVVLRPNEFARVPVVTKEFQQLRYEKVASFGNRDAILALSVFGRGYLEHDAEFHLFKLVGVEEQGPFEERMLEVAMLPAPIHKMFRLFEPVPVRSSTTFPISVGDFAGRPFFSMHPQTRLWFVPPATRCTVQADYLIYDGAYLDRRREDATNGVDFTLAEIRADGSRRVLFNRLLAPFNTPADRGLQHLQLDIEVAPDSELLFEATAGPDGNWSYDWAAVNSFSIRSTTAAAQ